MGHFLLAFGEIDKDGSGSITTKELKEYMIQQDYEENFVDKFLNLFDIDGDGSITLEEYRETLGIRLKSEPTRTSISRFSYNRPASSQWEAKNDLSHYLTNDVIIIKADMPKSMREQVIKMFLEIASSPRFDHDLASVLKRALDLRFGRAWHVVVGRGPYGTHVSNELGYMIHFGVGNLGIFLWRTPDY